MKKLNYLLLLGLAFSTLLISCKDDDDAAPAAENDQEIITDVKLIFTNTTNSSDVVTARAQDPDGGGVQPLAILDPINLGINKTYTLTYEIFNNLSTPGEDIGEEVAEENMDHKIFYSFSDNAFTSPTGNGNIDVYSDPLNYTDMDANGNPVGLSSTWTTPNTALTGGVFKTMLQHQPDGIKTATSSATDGDTDFELEFVLNIN